VSDHVDTQSGERKGGTRIRVHIQVSFKIASKQTSCAALKQADPADVIAVPRRKPGSEAGCRKSAGSNAGLKAIFSIDHGERQEVLNGMIDTVTKPKTKVKTKTERPRLHKVILLNDDYTPREFVVAVLKAEFRMTEDEAHRVMITAHRRGVCVVAVFTRDVAETKATRATDAGRAKGYPLLFTTEPEE
jgi:ATP-dependent Clp protease adaptor protein ClpS